MKAMILAAGLGTRLRPYTFSRPKPLFPVLDQPLLFRAVDQLIHAGCREIVVNAHHLRDQIISAVAGTPRITLQIEEEILGTGGGLRLACRHFDDGPVLVVNGDIFHTIDLARVYEWHSEAEAAVTMVLHDLPRFNKVRVAPEGRVLGFGAEGGGEGGARRLAFTGIHVIEPEVLTRIPPGIFYSIIDLYKELLREGRRIAALIMEDHYWSDIGTPEDYLQLHRDLLCGDFFAAQRSGGEAGPFYIGHDVSLASHSFEEWVCIGSRARIGRNVRLRRVVVWDGAEVPADTELSDAIIV